MTTFRGVLSSWRLIWLLSALIALVGCESVPQLVYRDRVVEKPVPVVQSIDPRLSKDCQPQTDVPQTGALTAAQVLDRLAAVEDALAFCRGQLGEIRALH